MNKLNLNSLEIIRSISPNDTMYKNDEHYFNTGLSGIQCIEGARLAANKDTSSIKKILDFGCGYGRVLRYIKSAFPTSEIYSSDLNKDAVDYCAETFNIVPIYSSKNSSEIKITESFDLIWVGSLFTHLDSKHWPGYIRLFESILNEAGILIFTVHGRNTISAIEDGKFRINEVDKIRMINEYNDTGFSYVNYENSEDYGTSVSSTDWVKSNLTKTNFKLISYTEKLWANNQDVVVCTKL